MNSFTTHVKSIRQLNQQNHRNIFLIKKPSRSIICHQSYYNDESKEGFSFKTLAVLTIGVFGLFGFGSFFTDSISTVKQSMDPNAKSNEF